MSLLRRIALSNGDKARKAKANAAIARMHQHQISEWNRQLKIEIYQKRTIETTLRLVHKLARKKRRTNRSKPERASVDPIS